jgi:hypothetical protein
MLGTVAFVTALAATQPVHLAECKVSAPVQDLHVGSDIGTSIEGRYELHVRFSDNTAEPIRRVVFELNDGSKIVDVGTFAPDVLIHHTFDLEPNTATSCAVTSATFADGARWTADSPAKDE